tara:strand:+ start:807 stop:1046 length:240 start_codon:yes stop_codon:yes gene_type:complete
MKKITPIYNELSKTAFKPWIDGLTYMEDIMHMERITNKDNQLWYVSNNEIPRWIYIMVISMGIAVTSGFILILLGSIYL